MLRSENRISPCCQVAATRERVSNTRETAYGNNLDLVAEGVGHRKATAALLGYPSWAHFVTETRMSGSPEVVVGLGCTADLYDGSSTLYRNC